MKIYSRSFLSALVLLLIFQTIVVLIVNLQRPYWGDEAHFVTTIRTFGDMLNWDTLRTYNEMSGPFPFVLYAVWGKIFGFETHILRILSVFIALITYLLFHRLVFVVFQNSRIALLTMILFVVQPYIIGFSVFVFTDMLAILFLLVVCLATFEQRPVLMALALSAGLLTRQFLGFLVLALAVFYSLRLREKRANIDLKMLIALCVSLLPLSLMIILWRGFSPDNEIKSLYLSNGFRFNMSYFIMYISQLFIYLFPLVLLSWHSIYFSNIKKTIMVFLLSWIYWLFPIIPSSSALENGIETVGFFHRATRFLVGAQWEQIILFVAFALGLPVLFSLILDTWKKWKTKNLDIIFFCSLTIISFLIVMSFSYLGWEKYFMPVIPIASLYLVSKYLTGHNRMV